VVFGDPISHQQMVGFLVTLFGMALWSPWDGSEKHQKKAMNETMEMGKTLEEL